MNQQGMRLDQPPEQFINGRIVGGESWHDHEQKEICIAAGGTLHCFGHWRVVDCETHAGPGKDIVECDMCGRQRTVTCRFNEDYQ